MTQVENWMMQYRILSKKKTGKSDQSFPKLFLYLLYFTLVAVKMFTSYLMEE